MRSFRVFALGNEQKTLIFIFCGLTFVNLQYIIEEITVAHSIFLKEKIKMKRKILLLLLLLAFVFIGSAFGADQRKNVKFDSGDPLIDFSDWKISGRIMTDKTGNATITMGETMKEGEGPFGDKA